MRLSKTLFRKKRNKESWFKYSVSLIHLWLGLLSGLVICVVSLTGAIYTFKHQIIDWYNYDLVYIEKVDKPFISLDTLQSNFKKQNVHIQRIVMPKLPNKSVLVTLSSDVVTESKTVYVNPYTGKILGAPNYSLSTFFDIVLQLHTNLMLGNIGKEIVGISVLIFVLMLITGFILWLPKKWTKKQLLSSLVINWKSKFKRLNYDLHKILGFYSLLILFLIAVTGLYVSYPWVKSGFIVAFGGTPVLSESADEDTKTELSNTFSDILKDMVAAENEKLNTLDTQLSLDAIYEKTNQNLNYYGVTVISLPNKDYPRFTITKMNDKNAWGALLPDELSFSKQGEIKKTVLFKNKPLHEKFITISLPLHTGEILGLPTLIIYFIAAIIGFSLPITGFIFWYKRY